MIDQSSQDNTTNQIYYIGNLNSMYISLCEIFSLSDELYEEEMKNHTSDTRHMLACMEKAEQHY